MSMKYNISGFELSVQPQLVERCKKIQKYNFKNGIVNFTEWQMKLFNEIFTDDNDSDIYYASNCGSGKTAATLEALLLTGELIVIVLKSHNIQLYHQYKKMIRMMVAKEVNILDLFNKEYDEQLGFNYDIILVNTENFEEIQYVHNKRRMYLLIDEVHTIVNYTEYQYATYKNAKDTDNHVLVDFYEGSSDRNLINIVKSYIIKK